MRPGEVLVVLGILPSDTYVHVAGYISFKRFT